ncbi:MAG: peptidase S8, partial [Ignavibacteriales bacterium UTCHB3]
NPFNPSTRIKFAIPQESQVELSVFDAAGRLVETLVSELKAPGYYEVVWNASNQASGIYFVTIKAGNQVQSIKMTLLK